MKTKKSEPRLWMAALAVAILALLALVAVAAAAETAAADGSGVAPPNDDYHYRDSLFSVVIIGGGPVGWLIILLSLVSFSLIIEHLVSIRREALCPLEILGAATALFQEQDYEEALAVMEADRSYLARILEAGLAQAPNRVAMGISIACARHEQTTKLRHKISYLRLIGNIAPMIGLFGTVLGMMLGFSEIGGSTGMPRPGRLARSIKVSLVTTFLGLFAAIPALAAFSLFRNRIEAAMSEVTTITDELLQGFYADDDPGTAMATTAMARRNADMPPN